MPVEAPADAFAEFNRNLDYARKLVEGGRRLGQLQVGAFDVDDLYRAAWVQAVAALDHWITRELIDRAVALARDPSAVRSPKFHKLTIPIELFEKVHYDDKPLDEVFRAHFAQTFGFMTFQNPDKIKEGFGYVSTVNLWLRVAQILERRRTDGEPITADLVRTRLKEIVRRRNQIAHTADHDADSPTSRAAITAEEVIATVDWLGTMATAIREAVGEPTPAPDYDSAPEEAGGLGAAPDVTEETPREVLTRGTGRWDEASLLDSIKRHCSPDVAETLLAVYRHAESHPAFRGYSFGEGAYPSVTAWFDIGGDEAPVWSIYTGVSKSVLSINFEWMRSRGAPVERLERLADSLAVFPGWSAMPETLRRDDHRRRPSLGPAALAGPLAMGLITGAVDQFLAPSGRAESR
ncbi:hypothetical protein [Actinoallomurus sp. NPDC052274]|uniref:hypothetical protein n=1 Tax=Actinoallomurus sp. NPDC052274 TaxID=3155420 RepID=UPI003430EA4D